MSKSLIIGSLVWKLMERVCSQLFALVVQVILARLLLPEYYGTIAIVAVFISIANILVMNSLNSGLIQKKDADDLDYSTIFFFSLAFAVILYGLFFSIAPLVAVFYEMPQIKDLMRVLSLSVFFGPFISIQNAVIAREFEFKKSFFSTLLASIPGGVVGIIAAYAGLGAWSLVIHTMTANFASILVMWHIVKWRPRLIFSLMRLKRLFGYSWKLLVSSLFNAIYLEISNLIIGKMYTHDVLAFYNRGDQLPKLLVNNLDGTIQSVMFSAYARAQDDKKQVKAIMRRAMVSSSFLVFPAMFGLAATSQSVIYLLLGEQWMNTVVFMQIACIAYSFVPIHAANIQALSGIGRSDIFLRLEVIKKIVGGVFLFVSLFFGVYAIAASALVTNIIGLVINTYPNGKILGYSLKEQIRDVLPILLLSISMGVIVYSINLLSLAPIIMLAMQIIVGVVIYFGLAWVLRLDCFIYTLKAIKLLIPRLRSR